MDYTEGRMNVTLPAEANSQTFRINVIDDNIIECSETFIVMIESVSPCGVTNGIVNSTEIIIIDDDSKLYVATQLHITQNKYDIFVITQVRGKAEEKC